MSSKKRSKLYTASIATSVLAASALVITPAQAESISFKDVTSSNSHVEAITNLANNGLIKGFTDGTYKPGKALTRGQAAVIFAKALNLDTKNVKDPGFKDVPKTHDYYGAIAALAQANIINGYEDHTFKMNKTITRGQLAKFIAVGLDIKAANNENLPFTDVEGNAYVKALYDHDITKGTSNTKFSPNAPVTRGQAATFIYKALQTKENVDVNTFDLTIMHSNDTHGRVEMAPKRATAVKEVRAKNPNALLLDAGDVNTGTLYYNEFKGQADLAFLNYMNYDAMTFGNHEFDAGSTTEGHQALVDFIKDSNFPFVSSNVDFSKDTKFTGLFSDLVSSDPANGKIYSGIVKELNGEKVGIFGLTTEETKAISSPGSIAFENYIKEAEKAVKAFEGLGVDKIIALSHLGYDDSAAVDNDLTLAQTVEGIDVIVGGHTHTQLTEPVAVTKNTKGEAKETTLIVQAYQYSDYLGTLDVSFDENGVVVAYDGELLKLADYADDAKALELLKPYKEKVDAVQNNPIDATTSEALINPRVTDEGNTSGVSVRKNETALGNLITDGMLNKAKKYTDKEVIMAFTNGGGIRAAINQGPITVGEVITVLPFGNTIALMDVTGKELKAAFEISVGKYPEENGGFLHVAGAKVEFDSSKPAGSRIVKISYKDANGNYVNLEDSKTYTVTTNAFTAKGGDGYDVLGTAYKEGRVTDLGLSDWENFAEHLTSIGSINPTTEGRIVDIATK
ncbi:5'-nucleotidase C-terminal domain-containing protein [Ureibacillus composti]|nr:5'-nucleotidase C-terminal domain-containing protein [Ureibacillus composti]